MTAVDHFNAFRAQLAGGILATRVHTAVRFNSDTPVRENYVVLFPAVAHDLDDARFTAPQRVESRALYRYDVRSVAVDAVGVLLYAQTVRERLIGHVLTVPGRSCTRIRLVDAVEEGAITYDRAANLYFITDTFEFWSEQAA